MRSPEGFTLSPQQRRVWRARELAPGPYRAVQLVTVRGDVTPERLRDGLRTVAGRHEILRTVFEHPPELKLPLQVVRQRPSLGGFELDGQTADVSKVVPGLPSIESLLHVRPDERSTLQAGLFRDSEGTLQLALALSAMCADSGSLEQLVRELAAAWRGDGGGAAAQGDRYQYADLAAWQNDLLESDDGREGVAYWEGRDLPGLEARLPVGDRTDSSSFHPRALAARLPGAVVRELSGSLAVSRQAALLTVWIALLSGRCPADDLTIAVHHDGRRYQELQEALGPFARPLPFGFGAVRGRLLGDLARQVEDGLSEAADWQELYAGQNPALHEAARSSPVYAFEAEPELGQYDADGHVSLRVRDRMVVDDYFELRLRWRTRTDTDEVAVRLDYDATILREREAQDVLDAWLAAVAAGARADRVSELPLLGGSEQRRLVVEFNEASDSELPNRCVHEMIGELAAADPEAPALSQGEERVSYGELWNRSGAIAARLQERGVRPESRVGIWGPRGPRLVEGILGILRAGAAYVPLDPGYPAERLEYMLRDSGAELVLVADDSGEPIRELEGIESLRVDEAGDRQGGAVLPKSDLDTLAYLIYTSGSTGRPRGVMVSHRALMNATHARTTVFGSRVAAFLLLAPVAFDSSVAGLFWTLYQGGELVLPPPGVERDPEAIAEAIERHGVSHLTLLPSLYRLLLEAARPEQLRSLRMGYVGGEACTPDLVSLHRERLGEIPLFHAYGPTENTVWSTVQEVGDLEQSSLRVGVGRPIPNTRAYVLDESLSPVPTGVTGEICLAGSSLARGYTGLPAYTAGRFVPDPFEVERGARLYRTGDLGRHRSDGNLEFIGRLDRQVKVRGYRIEPGEIEATLERHPLIERVVVEPRADTDETRLVGYYTARPDSLDDAESYELPNGLEVHHFDRFQTDALYRHVFEDDSYFREGVVLPDGARVIDVGANIGLFALRAAFRCRDVRVHAFEPAPEAARRLRANLARYGVVAKVFEHALGAAEEEREFTFYPHMSGMSGLYASRDEDRELAMRVVAASDSGRAGGTDEILEDRFTRERFECRVRRLSDVMREEGWERIDLLKIDAERSELAVLEGIDAEDWPRIAQVVVEIHDESDRVDRVRSLLSGAGFEVAVRGAGDLAETGLVTAYAVRSSRSLDDADGTRLRAPGLSSAALREFLSESMPPHMIPAAFVRLDAFPALPNGKVDRGALPGLDPASGETTGERPSGRAEECIAHIWEEVLGVDRVGRDDNFFELGGDSIIAIKVVTRAREDRLWLTPRDVFVHQTVRSLAAAARSGGGATAEQGRVSGAAPLTPVQRWFFELDLDRPERFALALELQREAIGDRSIWQSVAAAVSEQHDALRSRYAREGADWSARVAETEDPLVAWLDLEGTSGDERSIAIERAVDEVVDGLDLTRGPLWGILAARTGSDGSGTLVLVGHHLITDVISWQILLEDVDAAYRQAERGDAIGLPDKTTSFADWGRCLEEMAAAPELAAEIPFWERRLGEPVAPLPRDFPEGGNTVESIRAVRAQLGRDETDRLFTELPRRYRVDANDILLTALCLTCHEWTGERAVLVDIESHGRLEPSPEIDLSRTVGWFTCTYPARLRVEEADGVGRVLMATRGQLEQVPRGGLGYGLLRHLLGSPETRPIKEAPAAELTFNYIGQVDEFGGGEEPFRFVRDDHERRRHLLEFDAHVSEGRLVLTVRYSSNVHRRATVEALANGFMRTLRALAAGESLAGAEFGWSPEQLEEITAAIQGTEETRD